MMPFPYHLLERRREQHLPTLVFFSDGAQYELATLNLMGQNDDGAFEIGCLFTHQLASHYVASYTQKRADGFVYPERLIARISDVSSGIVLYTSTLHR